MKKNYGIPIIFFLLIQIFFLDCQSTKEIKSVNVQPDQLPLSFLSEYAFFDGKLKELKPNERVLPYDLNTPLFSDYAYKARFVWMPDSVRATIAENGQILFPENTVLIKNFYYPIDFSHPEKDWQMVETRLLYKKSDQWEAYTYIWNEEETDAKLSLIGDLQPVSWTDQRGKLHEIEYLVPNKNQCKSCHNADNKLEPIGPKVQNLNKETIYGTVQKNQLERWQELGLLEIDQPINNYSKIVNWEDASSDLSSRALAYLDVNCGHCHRSDGPAHTTGLYLTYDQTNKGRLGICKSPVAAGKGSGDRLFGVHPGQADSSILVFRMESNDPGIMMPELGRVIKHQEGIDLVRAWIDSMEGKCQEGLQIN